MPSIKGFPSPSAPSEKSEAPLTPLTAMSWPPVRPMSARLVIKTAPDAVTVTDLSAAVVQMGVIACGSRMVGGTPFFITLTYSLVPKKPRKSHLVSDTDNSDAVGSPPRPSITSPSSLASPQAPRASVAIFSPQAPVPSYPYFLLRLFIPAAAKTRSRMLNLSEMCGASGLNPFLDAGAVSQYVMEGGRVPHSKAGDGFDGRFIIATHIGTTVDGVTSITILELDDPQTPASWDLNAKPAPGVPVEEDANPPGSVPNPTFTLYAFDAATRETTTVRMGLAHLARFALNPFLDVSNGDENLSSHVRVEKGSHPK